MLAFLLLSLNSITAQEHKKPDQENKINNIDLSGEWDFEIDSLDDGVKNAWFSKNLTDKIKLPGSMNTNGKGNDITINTNWTGNFWNSKWFTDTAFEKYRQPGNIKVSFWLQPVKSYVGVAWYKKKITIPSEWNNKHIELFLERCHWETTLWIDDHKVGMRNALGAPHVYMLDNQLLTPGAHNICLRIDNRIKDIDPGRDAHSISDNTQTNWNGIIGKMNLTARPAVFISDVRLFPDVDRKVVQVKMVIQNESGKAVKEQVTISVSGVNQHLAVKLPTITRSIESGKDSSFIEMSYPMGQDAGLWDEFHPNLYNIKIALSGSDGVDEKQINFALRKFAVEGSHLTINNRPLFLRGTLECAIFPKTGYPPTDLASWMRIFRICRSYGLNHVRFHSWCPPEAAFDAADRSGFYLSIENSAWAAVGDGKPIDQFIYDESNRIVSNFGNHPSFCMMPYGNEPGGPHHVQYLTAFVKYWKAKDNRRLYTSASGWPIIPENDYNVTPAPRIQQWGQGVKSIINAKPPSTDYDWLDTIKKWPQPTVSHEIGQWCVYPNFKEMAEYTGILKPKNFEIFRDKMQENGLFELADSFLMASGKLQVLCYKADIEAALRTPGFGGFQLLDLHDFPGQGTALVGVVDPFWNDKGYVTAKEYSLFCNATVPLVRLPKMIYNNNENLSAGVEIAHFGYAALKNVVPEWKIADTSGKIIFSGKLSRTTIPVGNGFKLGTINQSLGSIKNPSELVLSVSVDGHENSWDIFVYPSTLPEADDEIYVTPQLDAHAEELLNKGGKVLLTVKPGSVKPEKGGNVAVGFSSIFWNTSWTKNQPPHTLGILCNPGHAAFKFFPTEYHSNWQWRDAISHSNAIRLDAVSSQIKPIVRIIDDWFTARPLGLVFECKVGKGKLLVSGIDLISDQEKRPEAKQLLYSLKNYMAGNEFDPDTAISIDRIKALF
ncbi:MAG: beta-galactosidase [Chitinophagaceae bacterium]|nr:beta-galactosidase [Chitinophagaceae bacterium]